MDINISLFNYNDLGIIKHDVVDSYHSVLGKKEKCCF